MASPSRLTKTILYAFLEAQATTDVDYRYWQTSTLNAKYDVQDGVEPETKPTLKYFGIGLTGFRNLDESTLAAPLEPSPSNMDIFTPIPFRIVPVEDDLSDEERSKYRMRVLKTVNEIDYYAYYLKVIEFDSESVQIIETNSTTGEETAISTLDADTYLSPDPDDANTTVDGYTSSATTRSVVKDGTFTITGAEVIEAMQVLYEGNLLYAKISEIGFYSGTDADVALVDDSGDTYTEAIYAQLAFHYTYLGAEFSNSTKVSTKRLRTSSAEAFLL
jgi:hypothetical protein